MTMSACIKAGCFLTTRRLFCCVAGLYSAETFQNYVTVSYVARAVWQYKTRVGVSLRSKFCFILLNLDKFVQQFLVICRRTFNLVFALLKYSYHIMSALKVYENISVVSFLAYFKATESCSCFIRAVYVSRLSTHFSVLCLLYLVFIFVFLKLPV